MNDVYKNMEAELDVMGASPHRLIQLMLDKCVQQIRMAKYSIEKNEVSKKCHSISKTLDIISYLRLMLNKDDPETRALSGHLDNLYAYIEQQLLTANRKNDVVSLNEALDKILKIKSSWDAIEEKV